MAYQIGSACVSCGVCADVCPVGAISQGDDRYVIDANAAWTAVPAGIRPNGAINPAGLIDQSGVTLAAMQPGIFWPAGGCRA